MSDGLMTDSSPIDVSENALRLIGNVLNLLLADHSTGKRIIWATDSYVHRGPAFGTEKPIQPKLISGTNSRVIQPRAAKSREEQLFRKREKAEVFTPLNVVERMNRATDQSLGYSRVSARNWKEFVSSRKLELACGEGPFIAGRYDPTATNQKVIPPKVRVGFLDRKFQAINQFVWDQTDWLAQAKLALQATYGYEWQGDSLLIARENVLQTVVDFFKDKFGSLLEPEVGFLEECAEIISWNIFQMDGIKFVIPMSCRDTVAPSTSTPLFGEPDVTGPNLSQCPGCKFEIPRDHNGIVVKVKDWETNEVFDFYKMLYS